METLLKVPLDESDAMLIGVDQLLNALPRDECITHLKNIIIATATAKNDLATCRWLEILKNIWVGDPPIGGVFSTVYNMWYERLDAFRKYLKDIFWEFPADISTASDSVAKSVLYKTKLWILGELIVLWDISYTKPSMEMFRFIIAAFGWQDREQKEKTAWEEKAVGRLVAEKTQKGILDLMRDFIPKREFEAGHLEFWMTQPFIPPAFLKILAHAWVRTADEITIARNFKRLSLFIYSCPELFSLEAQTALTHWSHDLGLLDLDIRRILTPWIKFELNKDRNGEITNITFVYPKYNEVLVKLKLREDISSDRAKEILYFLRKHFQAPPGVTPGSTVKLNILGKDIDLREEIKF